MQESPLHRVIVSRRAEMAGVGASIVLAAPLWPERHHAVIVLRDPRKGEQLFLVTDGPAAARDAFLREARATGLPELFVPRTVLKVDKLPLLGAGKIDLAATRALAQSALAGTSEPVS